MFDVPPQLSALWLLTSGILVNAPSPHLLKRLALIRILARKIIE
jgi:hypothetical protein